MKYEENDEVIIMKCDNNQPKSLIGSNGIIKSCDDEDESYRVLRPYGISYWFKENELELASKKKTYAIKKSEQKKDQGNKFDGDKLRMDLLSVPAMKGTAEVLTFGAKKYGDRNWEKGISFSRVYGALLRHVTSWWEGKNKDDETGINHLHHASCCLMFLQHYTDKKYDKYDDRPEG